MTIRMGVIGAGAISDVHLKALAAHDRVEVVCIADSSREAREGQARKYGIGHSVADYREMLVRPDLDAVDIAVPHHLHCPMTLDALSEGLHVICEKPIGLDLDEADRMIEAASRSKGRLLIKQYQRCAEHHTRAKEIIDSGELGDVYLMTGLFLAQLSRARERSRQLAGDLGPGGRRDPHRRRRPRGGPDAVHPRPCGGGLGDCEAARGRPSPQGGRHDEPHHRVRARRHRVGRVRELRHVAPRPDPGQGLLRHPRVAARVAGRPSDQAHPLDGRGIGGDHRGSRTGGRRPTSRW